MLIARRLTAIVALAAALSAGPAAASAAPAGLHVDAVLPLDQPVNIAYGYGALWVLSGFEQESYGYLNRVDPRTNTVTARWRLPSTDGGGLAVGFGSVWVSEYDANDVVRVDPATGAVQARIRVGLQPEDLHIAFGSVWSGDHHGQRVSRIDPATDRVVAQPVVGNRHAYRAGPQTLADDGHRLYVGVSVDQALYTVDPVTSRVSSVWRTPTDQFCGELVPVAGVVWSVDHCSNSLYRLDPATRAITALPYGTRGIESATVRRNLLWTAVDRDGADFTGGVLQGLDPGSGAVRATFDVGGDASTVRSLLGDLWVLDGTNGTVARISVNS